MKIFPTTKIGKWSVILITLFVIAFAFQMILIASGVKGGETFKETWEFAISGVFAGLCAIASFITGIIAMIKYKERALAIFITVIMGFLVMFFLIGEAIVAH